MDAELQAILNNITSLVEQAKQMAGGSVEGPAPEGGEEGFSPEMAEKVLKYLKAMDGEEDDDFGDEDDEVAKSDNGTQLGDDKAEKLIDDQPEENIKNVNEVAKALAMIMASQKKGRVAKSKEADPMKELFKVVKSLAVELKEQKAFNENLLKGLGIADNIIASTEVQKSQDKAKPMDVDPQAVAKSLEYIQSVLGQKKEEPVSGNKGHSIVKSLTDNEGEALTAMFANNARRVNKLQSK